jgi:hypothetical protein
MTMSSLGTINLTGKSGTQYAFNIYERSQKFKDVGAIYVMSKINSALRYSLIYIGETGDLSIRPLNHHRTACFDKNGADKLLIRVENDAKTRLSIETDLIRSYDTPCNKQ